MKNTFFPALLILLTMGIGLGISSEVAAQSKDEKKKTNIRVKVVEKKDGKTQVVERTYEIDPMSEGDQKVFVDKVLDSLGVNESGQKQISIMVDGDGDDDVRIQDRRRVETRSRTEADRDRGNADRDRDRMTWSWRDNDHEFHFDTDEIQDQVRRLEREIKPRVEVFRRDMEQMGDRMGTVWSNEIMQAGTVRGLNAYTNNPDNGVLNLRFSAPEKGDVTVTVTDTQGKEVGKKVIKDFSGEFVGQVDLKKNTKGTLFVAVVQNEDGAVRRVTIK